MISKKTIRTSSVILIALVSLGGVFMKTRYTAYSGELFSFQYPKDWTKRESQGTVEKYFQVHVFGKAAPGAGFGPSVTVTAYPERSQGGEFETLQDMVNGYLEKARRLKGYALQKDEAIILAPEKIPAHDLRMSYVLRLPLYDVSAKDVEVRERLVFFERGRQLYMLSYKNLSRDYPFFRAAFQNVLRTLRFRS